MTIPPGAFADCEKLETPHLLRPDGNEATAFKARAESLTALRKKVMAQDLRIRELEESQARTDAKLAAIPFPFGSP